MPTYLFQALDRNGSLMNGKVDAASVEAAREQVTDWGYKQIRFLQAFVFQASNSRGAPVTSEIEAENLDEAKALLVKSGFSRIKFHNSENVQAIREATLQRFSSDGKTFRRMSALEELGSARRRTLRHKILWAIGKHMIYLGPLLGWNALSLLRVGPIMPEDYLGFACTGLYLVGMTVKLTPMVTYHQILDANVWKDWDRVRRNIRMRRLASKILRRSVGEYDVEIREAYALASEGKLPEALAHMQRVRQKYPLARHLFLGRLASVYQHARLYDKQHACMVEALEAGPKRSLEWVDFATFLARRERDVEGAKAALLEARKFEMAELIKAATLKCSGMIALAERDYARAHDDLRLAVIGLTDTASTAMGEYLTTEAKAYLAIASAKLGRFEEARALWDGIEPLMKARDEDWLIRNYAEAQASGGTLK